MNQEPQLDELAARLVRAVPGMSAMRTELEQNFRALLRSHLDRLDLVSRERFDTQAELLARTRSQLEALEARIRVLENESTPNEGSA
ncbi:accessory factor UbiK family protein [Algiphilus sp.]|jgi:BMFP domain-containing protein YqiC|uniref:accessory factor UbiK family protein n=1 Tax=Algiphilus sp. TaxID=1872431 RepID=UPI001CA6F444|nr:accessory factor UbiK family protein [Algiphilus sp.]MBY8964570.1 accessory factor UbiK family protein [Algiphilus acroporae]MCI5061858.1 accessory factor UbiK family protein [Algiphilus sp.]MCI5103755.1 accessory factor UbiK family protein [Algiphilus sp.]